MATVCDVTWFASLHVAIRGVFGECGSLQRAARREHWQPLWSRLSVVSRTIVTSVVILGLLVTLDRDAQGQHLYHGRGHSGSWHSGHHHHHRSSFHFSYRPFIGYSGGYIPYNYGVQSIYAYSPNTTFSAGVIAPQYYGGFPTYGAPAFGSYSTGFGGAYPWGYPLYSGGYYPAPLFVPADTIFGPGAVRRQMGIDPPIAPTPGLNAPVLPQFPALAGVQPAPGVVPPLAPPANPPARPVVNDQMRARAQEHLNAGDQHFRGGRYHIALQRYKDATTAVPDLAEGFMRQGWALLALNQYDVAARAMRKGLQLKPDWHTAAFRLQDIYPDGIAKGAHRDALERAARDRDTDPQMSFLAGLFAWADRDMDRARGWLTKANQHEIGDATYITTFLNILPQALPAPANANPPAIAPPANAAPPNAPAKP